MRYLRLYESFEEIHEICREYGIRHYTINTDGTIDVAQRIVPVGLCLTRKAAFVVDVATRVFPYATSALLRSVSVPLKIP